MLNLRTFTNLVRLMVGLYLFSVGIVMTINANLGLAPWDVFHQGISKQTGITMGEASIYVGIVIIFFNFLFKEKVGIGSLCNMYFIGLFLDQIMAQGWIPVYTTLWMQYAMMFGGMFIISIGSYLYISSALGSGPRDALMVALHVYTGKSVRFVRNAIELFFLAIGILLGGKFGIGTIIMATTIGYFVQFVFYLFKFDIKNVEHTYIELPSDLFKK